jgi:hypothetical protein
MQYDYFSSGATEERCDTCHSGDSELEFLLVAVFLDTLPPLGSQKSPHCQFLDSTYLI